MPAVEVEIPGKLLLLGDHAVVYDRPCLVAAINTYITLSADPLNDSVLKLDAEDLGLTDYIKNISDLTTGEVPAAASYVESAVAAYNEAHPIDGGVSLRSQANTMDARFGFGTSAAISVATVKALAKQQGIELTKKEIFNIAYSGVLKLVGIGSGADVASSTYGGILYFVTGGKVIEPVQTAPLDIIVGYSGYKGHTPTIIKQVAAFGETHPDEFKEILESCTTLVEQGRLALESANYQEFGTYMNSYQQLLVRLGVCTLELSTICEVMLKAGAYGAKISGAGGGDCAIALVPPDRYEQVTKAVEDAGFAALHIKAGVINE